MKLNDKRFWILLIVMANAALVCSGQSFLAKYPKLTITNLSEFFAEWVAYSDSIAVKNIIEDSVVANIVNQEYIVLELAGRKSKYCIVPQKIEVERYYLDIDTVIAKHEFGFPSYIPDMKENQYRIDSITPILPHNGLYLTSDINKALSKYAGGLRKGNKTGKINKTNIVKLEHYIPVNYGHWGGYWWFTSFPLITKICYSNNLIAVMRRTSWCTGDVIWYVKENGAFTRREQPITSWIE